MSIDKDMSSLSPICIRKMLIISTFCIQSESINETERKKRILILDLDETLIYARAQCNHGKKVEDWVIQYRQGLMDFLIDMRENWEIWTWTASVETSKKAGHSYPFYSAVVEKLERKVNEVLIERKRLGQIGEFEEFKFKHSFYRQHCERVDTPLYRYDRFGNRQRIRDKTTFEKKLENLSDYVPIDLPSMVMVDNQPYTVFPKGKCIAIQDYGGGERDGVHGLGFIKGVLNRLVESNDTDTDSIEKAVELEEKSREKKPPKKEIGAGCDCAMM